MEPPQLAKKKCLRCGHEWVPRVAKPLRCPKCMAYDWDKEEEKKGKGGEIAGKILYLGRQNKNLNKGVFDEKGEIVNLSW